MKKLDVKTIVSIIVSILCIIALENILLYKSILKNYVYPREEKILALEEELKRSILTEPDFFYLSPQEGLMDALEYYDVQCPEIVYAQAILETGNFKSSMAVYDNNLFGLYDSRKKKYMTFKHWSEAVIAYRDKVQYRWNSEKEDYYHFLDRIGYASDSLYTKKLKNIVNTPSRK